MNEWYKTDSWLCLCSFVFPDNSEAVGRDLVAGYVWTELLEPSGGPAMPVASGRPSPKRSQHKNLHPQSESPRLLRREVWELTPHLYMREWEGNFGKIQGWVEVQGQIFFPWKKTRWTSLTDQFKRGTSFLTLSANVCTLVREMLSSQPLLLVFEFSVHLSKEPQCCMQSVTKLVVKPAS